MNLVEITQNLLKTFATLRQRLKKGQVSQMTDSVHVQAIGLYSISSFPTMEAQTHPSHLDTFMQMLQFQCLNLNWNSTHNFYSHLAKISLILRNSFSFIKLHFCQGTANFMQLTDRKFNFSPSLAFKCFKNCIKESEKESLFIFSISLNITYP